MIGHFTQADLLGVWESVFLFALILFVPGYAVGWLLNLVDFRERALRTQLAVVVPFSIGICPIIAWLCLRFLSLTAAAILLAVFLVVFAVALYGGRRNGLRAFGRQEWGFVAIAGAWVVGAAFALVDLQIGHRLYFPSVTSDYATRVAITSSIARTGVPPANPWFFPGHVVALRYHYFWFVLCALVERMGGPAVTPRLAMIAGTVWCGIGLLAIGPLYLRFFQRRSDASLNRRMLLATALLAVTGLDIVPALWMERTTGIFLFSVDFWNDPIASWTDSIFWVPHHVAALIACLAGFLLLWHVRARAVRGAATHSLAAGVMFASAAGLSVYVTLVFAAFTAVWMGMSMLRKQRAHTISLALAGLTAVALVSPYLRDLFHSSSSASGPTSASGTAVPLMFAVKPFRIPDIFLGFREGSWQMNLFNVFALPLNYTIEFGFFALVAIVMGARLWRDRRALRDDQLCAMAMAATAAIICTFVRSSVISNNDLGWRGFLIAQFVLLLWGAELLASRAFPRTAGWRAVIAATLVLGVAGSLYEVVKVRFLGPLLDINSPRLAYTWLRRDTNLGARTAGLRELYERLKQITPAGAVYQHNPDVNPQDLFSGMYADRQIAAETMNCAVAFGGDPALCAERIHIIDDLFEHPAAVDAAKVDDICSRFSINVLIAKDIDPVWRDRKSWVWTRKPLAETSWGRAFECGVAPALLRKDRPLIRWI